MRRPAVAVVTALTVLVLAAACSGDGDSDDGNTTPAAPAETPDRVRTVVYERSFSECASYGIRRLAAKYRVSRTRTAVGTAVARNWVEFFDAGPDAIPSGRDGCLQGMRLR